MRPHPPDRDHPRALVRQSGLTTLAAAGAVATGLIVDVAIAARFGAGEATDALFVAARIPLGIVAILMVGANQALVPAITTSLERRGGEPTARLVSALVTGSILLGLGLFAIVAFAAGPLMRVTAPGLPEASIERAAELARVFFLVVPLVAAAEVLRAALNAKYSFIVPAAMPAVLSLVTASIVLGVAGTIEVVAWAYVAGATVQLAFMLVMAASRGFAVRPSFAFRDAETVAAASLSVRPLIGAGLNPLARVGEQLFVSFLPPGSITIVNYGYRLVSAIGGAVLFRSVMIALVPRLTSAIARADEAATRRLTNLGVRIMFAVSMFLTPFMAVLATPAAIALFHRGSFSRHDAALLGLVLAVYAGSLVGSGVQRALLAPFFARLDTRTPLRNTIYGVGAGLLLVPVFVFPFGQREIAVVGVAIAYSLSQYVHVAHAWWRVRVEGIRIGGFWRSALRWTAASAACAVALIVGRAAFDLTSVGSRWTLVAETLVVASAGLAAGAVTLAFVGRTEARALHEALRMRPSATS